MATLAMMMAIGASIECDSIYRRKYILQNSISGRNVDTEKIRHDKAMEKYQRDYEAYQEKRQKMLDWKMKKKDEKYQASKNISTTNQAFELYGQNALNPNFQIITNQVMSQKTGEMIYVGAGMLGLGYAVSKFL